MNHADPNTQVTHRLLRRYAIAAAKIVGVILLLATLVLVSWNMFAPDMFGLEAIRMKHALGLVVFAGTFALVFRLAASWKHGAGAAPGA
ncbi:MAG: hypothetical protein ACE5JZ_09690 [Kiloniellales bacterium]